MRSASFFCCLFIVSCEVEDYTGQRMQFVPAHTSFFEEKEIKFLKEVLLSPEEQEESICSICLGMYDEGAIVLTTPCKHQFHAECIEIWLDTKNSCPNCRMKIKKTVKKCVGLNCVLSTISVVGLIFIVAISILHD